MDFWRIAMRPGKPLMFAAKDRARVLGLPGNPVSTMVCALLFLKPAMERMIGQAGDLPADRAGPARGRREGERPAPGLCPLPATRQPDGSLTVEPHKVQDSSMLSVLAWCNALLIRPAARPGAKGRRHRANCRSFCSPRRLLIPSVLGKT